MKHSYGSLLRLPARSSSLAALTSCTTTSRLASGHSTATGTSRAPSTAPNLAIPDTMATSGVPGNVDENLQTVSCGF